MIIVDTPRLSRVLHSKVCHPAVHASHRDGYSHVCSKAGIPHVTHECSCGVSWFPVPKEER